MKEINVNEFNKICRFCLKSNRILNLLFYDDFKSDKNDRVKYFLNTNQQSLDIIEMIYLCTGLKVNVIVFIFKHCYLFHMLNSIEWKF